MLELYTYLYYWLLAGAVVNIVMHIEVFILYTQVEGRHTHSLARSVLKSLLISMLLKMILFCLLGPLGILRHKRFSRNMRAHHRLFGEEVYHDDLGLGRVEGVERASLYKKHGKLLVKFYQVDDVLAMDIDSIIHINKQT